MIFEAQRLMRASGTPGTQWSTFEGANMHSHFREMSHDPMRRMRHAVVSLVWPKLMNLFSDIEIAQIGVADANSWWGAARHAT